MLLALTGYEIGLLLVAVAFIVFALVVALVIPRTRPEFPGKALGLFVAVCLVFFVAQMTAVVALAELGEGEHAEAVETTEPTETEPTETETRPAETEPVETEPTETEPTETDTTTGETETTPTETTEEQGDAVAGKEVYLGSAACGSCHTLADAGSSGTIGPNLDAASPSYDKVIERVTEGKPPMPSFKDTLSEQQIRDVAAYVSSVVE